jgi:xanthine dehydrogenase accessory factor
MNVETAKAALALVEAGEDFAWATIIDTQGSAPRHVAASMLVKTGGSIVGTIGGGPLEAAVIRESLVVLSSAKTRLMPFDSAGLGMACGGGGLVSIEYVDSSRPTTLDLHRGLLDLLARGRKGWLVAVIQESREPEATVAKCLVDSEGIVYGEPVLPPTTLQELARTGGAHNLSTTDEAARIYVQPVGAQGTAYVFGAGHCGEKLVPVLNSLDFFTVVIDDRSDFANRERFPGADGIVVPESFDGAVVTLPIEEDSYIVIVTRGHLHDKSVLRQALTTRAGYIGMMGSKRKVAEIFRALREEGFSSQELERVYTPIGLSIGAETPEEIAISIAGELIQVRAAKRR